MALDPKNRPDQDTPDHLDDGSFDERYNTARGLQQLEDHASNPKDSNSEGAVKDREKEAGADSPIPYEPTRSEGKGDRSGRTHSARARKFVGFAKKRGGIIGLIATFGVGGGILAGFMGPATMLINLTENLSLKNDTSSTVMERRFLKAFQFTHSGDPNCVSTKMKCKMGRISNSALTKLQRKGVTPVFDNNTKGVIKRTGYPDKNPTSYDFDLGNGRTQNVPASEMSGFLSQRENRGLARKLLGTGGAFKMRFVAWNSKYLTKKLFRARPLSIVRNGGASSEDNKNLTKEERRLKMRESLKADPNVVKSATGRSIAIVDKNMGKAKKGGTGYLMAVGSCMAVKAPKIIAGAVAAVQLAQIMPIVMDLVLSPGSNAKGSLKTSFSSEDADAIGTLLTEQKPRKADGKLSSALDSPILLAALGIESNKTPVSKAKDIIPGYRILTSPLVTKATKADKSMEPACNAIMSPAAMYSAMVLDAAVTVALSTTIVGGLIKVAASVVASEIAMNVVKSLVADAAEEAITEIAENDLIEAAEGEELGDVIGISAMTLFSSASMSRMIPTLTTSQLTAFNHLQHENEQFKKEMDIAGLSPFDTSSRHTFLGSIVHNMGNIMVASRNYNDSLASITQNLFRVPATSLSLFSPVGASSGMDTNYCGYAEDFGLTIETEKHTAQPAINMAGMPCTGITPEQDAISTEEAFELMEKEGWIKPEVDVESWDTVDDLVEAGYIEQDTPLHDFIETCGRPETGEYLFNAGGCIVHDTKGSKPGPEKSHCYQDGEGESLSENCITMEDMPDGLNDPRSMQAMSVFMIDLQVIQSLNGEDDEALLETPESSGSDLDGEVIDTPSKDGWSSPMNAPITFGYHKTGRRGLHKGIDFGAPRGTPVYSAHDGEVTMVRDMGSCGWATAITAEGVNGIWHAYQHMDPSVKVGDRVRRGQQIGVVGRFCGSGHHLHFSIETANRVSAYTDSGANDTSKDPALYLPSGGS